MDQGKPTCWFDPQASSFCSGTWRPLQDTSGSSRRAINVPTADPRRSQLHYSRMCPIETPEDQTLVLSALLALYAHVNEYGFIEALIVVTDGAVSDDIVWMTADEEENHIIAPANTQLTLSLRSLLRLTQTARLS